MSKLEQKVRPHSEVVDTAISEEEVALLHLENKNYFSLNVTGARIWEGLKSGLGLEQICQSLQKEFDVSAEHAERSVLELVEELSRQNLVDIDD